MCKLFHQPGLNDAEEEDLQAAFKRLLPELSTEKWPSETLNGLLSRMLVRLKMRKQFKELVDASDPWLNADWEFTSPKTGTVPGLPETSKISVCSRVLFREVMLHYIGEGAEGLENFKECAKHAIARFSDYDALDMTSVGLSVLKDYLVICEGMVGLGDFTTGLKYKARVLFVSSGAFHFRTATP